MYKYYYITYLYFIIDFLFNIGNILNYFYMNDGMHKLLKYLNKKQIKYSKNELIKMLFMINICSILITILNSSLVFTVATSKVHIFNLPYKTIEIVSAFDLNVEHIYIIYIFLNFASVFLNFFKNFEKISKKCRKKSEIVPLNGKNIYFDSKKVLTLTNMYKNILITGSIGSGKTSTGIKLFLEYFIKNNIYGVILDVKGNFKDKFLGVDKNKIIIIGMETEIRYNPLHIKNISEIELASYLRNVLEIITTNITETYWLEKAENLLHALIIYIKLDNQNLSFYSIHKLLTNDYELKNIHNRLKEKIGCMSQENLHKFEFASNFIFCEFSNLDFRVTSIIKSEISRITIPFISDYYLKKRFCTHSTFSFDSEKYILVSFNKGKYNAVGKILSIFLKEHYKKYILSNFNRTNPVFLICDEYQEFALKNDAQFLALSREAKCISVLAMQSYTSLKEKINNEDSSNLIIQNCVNKIWYRQDDIYTANKIVEYFGKIKIKRENETISQMSNNSHYSR